MEDNRNESTIDLSNGDHDTLVRTVQAVKTLNDEVIHLRSWRYDVVPPIIAALQTTTSNNARQISDLVDTVKGVVASVQELMRLPIELRSHKDECLFATNELTKKVDRGFDTSESQRAQLGERLDTLGDHLETTRKWVVTGVVSGLLMIVTALVGVIWVAILKSGVLLFGS